MEKDGISRVFFLNERPGRQRQVKETFPKSGPLVGGPDAEKISDRADCSCHEIYQTNNPHWSVRRGGEIFEVKMSKGDISLRCSDLVRNLEERFGKGMTIIVL